ncbi:MAG: hypothetical protein AB7S26_08700 [Sandaracinaceae bacterium]
MLANSAINREKRRLGRRRECDGHAVAEQDSDSDSDSESDSDSDSEGMEWPASYSPRSP